MKKLFASALVAAALCVPVGSAVAAESAEYVGTDDCWAGQVGIVVWRWDPIRQEKVYYRLCIQTGP